MSTFSGIIVIKSEDHSTKNPYAIQVVVNSAGFSKKLESVLTDD